MSTKLNTTDFAILGLLARKPWSAYEMTQYMRYSNVRAVWPRAESRIYESPKKLANIGYATVKTEQQGKRSRAVYEITPAGKEALETWLCEDGKSFSFEYEALLKLTLSDIADTEYESNRLSILTQQAQSDYDQLENWFKLFAQREETDISADRMAQNLLVNSFIKELLEARLRWSEMAFAFQEKYQACTSEEEKSELVALQYQAMVK